MPVVSLWAVRRLAFLFVFVVVLLLIWEGLSRWGLCTHSDRWSWKTEERQLDVSLRERPVSNVPPRPWLVPPSELLCEDSNVQGEINSQVAFDHGFTTAIEKETNTLVNSLKGF